MVLGKFSPGRLSLDNCPQQISPWKIHHPEKCPRWIAPKILPPGRYTSRQKLSPPLKLPLAKFPLTYSIILVLQGRNKYDIFKLIVQNLCGIAAYFLKNLIIFPYFPLYARTFSQSESLKMFWKHYQMSWTWFDIKVRLVLESLFIQAIA